LRSGYTLLCVLACACAGSSLTPQRAEPSPSPPDAAIDTTSATTVEALDADASKVAPFKVETETLHVKEPDVGVFLATVGHMNAGRDESVPSAHFDAAVGALRDATAKVACFVAIGGDYADTCVATVTGVGGPPDERVAQVTIAADFEQDSMQSRSKNHTTLSGTITTDASHAIVRATFRGREELQLRFPCEKIGDCEKCDPLPHTPRCPAKCFCPFRNVGTADVATSYSAQPSVHVGRSTTTP